MNKKLFVSFVLSILVVSCSPSEAAISTAIAKTQEALPTKTETPTPSPTATPFLYKTNGQEFLPLSSDMPEGFQLQPSSSGAMNIENGQSYVLSYYNSANVMSFKDASRVIFQTLVFNSENDGKALFKIFKNDRYVDIVSLYFKEDLYNVEYIDFDIPIPGVDDYVSITGKLPLSGNIALPPAYLCSLGTRTKNLVLLVVLAMDDFEGGKEICLSQLNFYTSIVTSKINSSR